MLSKQFTRQKNDSGDFVFKLVGDKHVKVHKCMISLVSPEFDLFIRDNPSGGIPYRPQPQVPVGAPQPPPQPYKRLSSEALECYLRFLYYGDKRIGMLPATQIYTFVKDFKLDDYLPVVERALETLDVDVPSAVFLLQIALTEMTNPPLQNTLKSKSLTFILSHFEKIDFKVLDSMHPRLALEIVLTVQNAIVNFGQWNQLVQTLPKQKHPLPSSPSLATILPIATHPSSSAPLVSVSATSTTTVPSPRSPKESNGDAKDRNKKDKRN